MGQTKKPAVVATANPPPPKVNLRALALDIVEGKVFGSWSLRNPDKDLQLVFMVLLFCKKGDIPKDTGAIYEYMDRAGPTSINGMPTFFSCGFLTQAEYKEVCVYVQEIRKIRESFLQPNDEKPKTDNTGHAQSTSATTQLDSRGGTSRPSGASNSESSDDPASNRLRKLFKRKPASSGLVKKTRS
jgi:hypothetical protein